MPNKITFASVSRSSALTVGFLLMAVAAFAHEEHAGTAVDPFKADQPVLDALPTWHPLVVHLPVMLIPLALGFGVIALFRKEMTWKVVTGLCLLGGVVGAALSSYTFHPHTASLPAEVAAILEEHESYADWTLWLGVAALLSSAVWYFLPDWRRVAGIATLVLLLGATAAVTLAGHHGAMLTYQGGVGARGAFLEVHED